MPALTFKYFTYYCIIALFLLCIVGDFYRNRDPYKAYFHSRDDHYLTTHLIDSDFNHHCLELESRLAGKTSSSFADAIKELYSDKQIILPNTYLLSHNLLLQTTGQDPIIQQSVVNIPDASIQKLLRQGTYSFLYSPLSFSSLERTQLVTETGTPPDHCLQLIPLWDKNDFPLLTVLLPLQSPDDPYIKVILKDKYLLFIPSHHPIFESTK